MPSLIKVSAPGSTMILGEHAVLYGKQAVVAALNKRMHVELLPREDNKINIESGLGNFSVAIGDLKVEKPFQFVLAVLKHYQKALPSGCDLKIKSDFSSNLGFGSSAAVTVAMLKAVLLWLKVQLDEKIFVETAVNIIREVQGLGSGADVCASTLGGVVAFQSEPLYFERLESVFPIKLIYCGYKTPTVEVVKKVQGFMALFPEKGMTILEGIAKCSEEGIAAIKEKNWDALGRVFSRQQSWMRELKLSDEAIEKIIAEESGLDDTIATKISGSGLGDCVISLARSEGSIKITKQGVLSE